MTSQVAVVDIPSDPDDDDTAAVATPPSLRKRSHAALAATSPDSLDDFSPSPPILKWRPSSSPIVLDDTPTPPKRWPSVAPERPVSGVAETRQSVVPCSLGSRAAVAETPNSVLPCSSRFRSAVTETPGSAVPCSIGSDIVVAETPGFTSLRSAGPPAAPGLPSNAVARKLSGVSCPISLDSDDELDDTVYREPLTKLPSNTAKSEPVIQPGTSSCYNKVDSATSTYRKDNSKPFAGHQTVFSASTNGGTTSYGQPLPADLPCEVSGLQDADVFTEKHNPQDERHNETESIGRERSFAQTAARRRQQDGDQSRLIEEGKRKQQEEKKRQKEEDVRLVEEKKKKQQVWLSKKEEKRLKKEEKARLTEERKQKLQENKMQKEALKAQLAEVKNLDKEKRKWESGKFASKSIIAEIDSSVIESGSVGGHLLSRFAEKGLSFRVKPNNVIRGSILWKMEVPKEFSQPQASVLEVPYILFVLQAEEFCDLVSGGSFLDHVHKVRSHYPTFTICYVTNKLMNYIKKREQSQYKNPSNSNSWQRPPVEEVLCKLATHYVGVHSRQCADEAEVADHVVGLTSSLATCKFRKPLTWLSVHANGSIIPKGFIDKALAKKSTWLKSLIAIPKVQPRHALAIYKKYPSMRSLLNVYMDSSKTVREKELLLEDLKLEGRLGDENRRFGEKCSRRVYRILMAENGATRTDDVEK